MCGKNHVRYISLLIMGVLIVIGLCGFALASASSTPPVKGTSPSSKPTSSKPVSGVKRGASQAPILTSISPSQGREGDNVTLTGTEFGSVQGSSYVSFGPFKASVYSGWSDISITCVVSPITGFTFPVTGPVTVTTSNGTSNWVSFKAFAPNPTVTYFSPPMWVSNSVVRMAIVGTGFQKGASLSIGPFDDANPAPDLLVSNVVVASSTKITCKVKIPGWSKMVSYPDFAFPVYSANVKNPDGGFGDGGQLAIETNPCGAGAISPIIGFGLAMGMITLAGTVRARRRRTKKS